MTTPNQRPKSPEQVEQAGKSVHYVRIAVNGDRAGLERLQRSARRRRSAQRQDPPTLALPEAGAAGPAP